MKSLISNYKLLICPALLFLVPAALAYQGDYGTESIFMSGAGARPDAMGRAYTAMAGDLSSSFYNPAGLALLEKQSAMFLHYPMYENAIYDSVSYGIPLLDFGAISAVFIRFYSGDIPGYDITDKSTGFFSSDEYKATVSYAKNISPGLYAGVSVNVFSSNISDFNTTGFGADAGVLYEPFPFLRAGLCVQNLIKPSFTMKNSKEGLPQRYILGLLGKYSAFGFKFSAASDFIFGENESFKNRSGLEICWLSFSSARVGYDDGRLCFGGGLSLLGADMDYAFIAGNYAGGLHRFTLSYNFGQTLSEQKKARRQAMLEEVRKLVDEKMAAKTAEKSAEYYKKAYALYMSGDLEAALVEAEKAADWQPSNGNAAKMKVILTGKLKEKIYAGTKQDTKSANNQYFDMGVDYYIRKQYARAASAWEKAQEMDPENQNIKKYLAAARRILKSVQTGGDISAPQAEEVKNLYYAGINAYTAGDIEKAAAIWEEALMIDPADVKSARGVEKARMELEEYKKRGLK